MRIRFTTWQGIAVSITSSLGYLLISLAGNGKSDKGLLWGWHTTLVYLHFVAYLAASLSQFMQLFQTDESLIHVWYDKVNELTCAFFRKFLKPDVVDGKEGADLIAVDCEKADNWLPRNEMETGSGTKRVLASKPDDKKKTVWLAFRKCLKTMAIYLKDHLPVNNVIPKYIYIGQQSFAGPYIHVYFGYTARPTVFTPRIQKSRRRKSNSWPVVSTHEKSGKDWPIVWQLSVQNGSCRFMPVILQWTVQLWSSVMTCAYWVHVSNMVDTVGEKKYQHASFVTKAALTLSHSNASSDPNVSFRWTMLWWRQIGDHCQKEVLSLSMLWRKLSVCLVLALKFPCNQKI